MLRKFNLLRRLPPTTEVQSALADLLTPASRLKEYWDKIKHLQAAFNTMLAEHSFDLPDQPREDQLISRIFSPEKFLRFLAEPGFFLNKPSQFPDRYEGVYPSDLVMEYKIGTEDWVNSQTYQNASDRDSLLYSCNLMTKSAPEYPGGICSCWTEIGDARHFSEVLWQHHASGQNGVAVIGTYESIRLHFRNELYDENLIAGNVSYAGASNMHPAFRKRPAFSHENEVRFFTGTSDMPFQTEKHIRDWPSLELGFSDDVDSGFRNHAERLAADTNLFVDAVS